MRVAVIGAGMIGTSIAAELAARGATVELIDRADPGTGTSATSYAWVNANNKTPDSYFRLNVAGVQAHRRLAAGGADWLHANGHVEFAVDPDHRLELRRRIERLRHLQYPVEMITVARARELVADLVIADDCDTIAFYPDEAHLRPDRYVASRLATAVRLGARLRTGVGVVGFEAGDAGVRVALADGTSLDVDRVVGATGRWTNELTRCADLPALMIENQQPGDLTVGYLARTTPGSFALNRLVTSPKLNVRPNGDGRLLLQALDLDATADPARVPGTDSRLGREFLTRLAALLSDVDDVALSELVVGYRAMPRDMRSVIGALPAAPWLYLVATHSGVTLAPLLGSGVAAELYGEQQRLFDDFRPDRLLTPGSCGGLPAPRRPGEQ